MVFTVYSNPETMNFISAQSHVGFSLEFDGLGEVFLGSVGVLELWEEDDKGTGGERGGEGCFSFTGIVGNGLGSGALVTLVELVGAGWLERGAYSLRTIWP